MCVVRSNFESIRRFPDLLADYGATQLHLDMVRPMDAGARTDAEFRAMIPRYSDLVPALDAMIAGLPEGFDVNIGNLPYCIAPHLARFIHHDGETTFTVAVDGENALSEPWDKYAVKRRDKSKPATCRDVRVRRALQRCIRQVPARCMASPSCRRSRPGPRRGSTPGASALGAARSRDLIRSPPGRRRRRSRECPSRRERARSPCEPFRRAP